MADDNTALLLQVSADVSRLEKQFAKAQGIVDKGSRAMEQRAETFSGRLEKLFGKTDPAKALDKVFDSTRFKVLDSGVARVGIFGSAIEELGPEGLVAAAGIGALALAVEGVRKAMEEVGQLKITADKAGLPIEALQELQFAAKESHVPVETLNAALLNLNDTLGRLRSGVGAARLQKLADELGLTPADLKDVKTAADLLPILADRIKALPSLSEQFAAANKAGVGEILPLLLKGGEGVKDLMAEYKALGVEISGPTAANVEAGNLELEKAHDITHDKLRNALIELHPLIVSLGTAWDDFAAHAIDALTSVSSAYDGFVKRASQLANQQSGNGFADLGANLLGRFNLAIARPTTAALAAFGFPRAQQEFLHGPAALQPPAQAAAASAAAASGPTPAMLAAELEAKNKLDQLEARFLTHTTNRLEAERAIEAINAKRAAAGDKPLDKATADKILAAASAVDVKHNTPHTRAGPSDQTDSLDKAATDALDSATRAAAAAQAKLAGTIAERSKFEQAALDAARDKSLDDLDAQEKNIRKSKNDAHKTEQLALIGKARAEVENRHLAETEALLRQTIVDQLGQEQAQVDADAQLRTSSLQHEEDHFAALSHLTGSTEQRAEFEREALRRAQQREAVLAQNEVDRATSELAVATALQDQAKTTAAQNHLRQAIADQAALPQEQADTTAQLQRQQALDAHPLLAWIEAARNFNQIAEGAGVQALDNLATGLADAIVNAKNLGQVVGNVFRQLIADLLAAAIRRDIETPLLSAAGVKLPAAAAGAATSAASAAPQAAAITAASATGASEMGVAVTTAGASAATAMGTAIATAGSEAAAAIGTAMAVHGAGGGGGLFGALFKGLGSFGGGGIDFGSALKDWGGSFALVPGFASGGAISGPGSGTSDSIPAMLSAGEFVVNADAARRHRALLERINAGQGLPRFAAGGLVGAVTMPQLPVLEGIRRLQIPQAPQANAPAAVYQSFDLRGAVVMDELYRNMQSIAAQHAAQALKSANRALPTRQQSLQLLGT